MIQAPEEQKKKRSSTHRRSLTQPC